MCWQFVVKCNVGQLIKLTIKRMHSSSIIYLGHLKTIIQIITITTCVYVCSNRIFAHNKFPKWNQNPLHAHFGAGVFVCVVFFVAARGHKSHSLVGQHSSMWDCADTRPDSWATAGGTRFCHSHWKCASNRCRWLGCLWRQRQTPNVECPHEHRPRHEHHQHTNEQTNNSGWWHSEARHKTMFHRMAEHACREWERRTRKKTEQQHA